jgi:hypothetical protein
MVYRAILICSETECTERFEARGTLAELEALACECGCALQIVGWPERTDGDDERLDLLAA